MTEVEETKFGSQEKYSKWVVAILSLLVIFQGVILVSARQAAPPAGNLKEATLVPLVETSKQAAARLAFVPSGVSLKKNDSASVDIFLTPKRLVKLDGIDVVLSFNPQVLQITQVTTPKLFSFVSQKKEKEKEGKIYLTFLEEKSGGLAINKQVKLLTLTVKGKTAGTGDIFILTAEEGPSTVITESGTSRKLPFDQENFKVLVKE